MAEIIFRIPSKAVTYGYVEIPVTLTDDPAPEALAAMYVNYVYAFQKEEQAALQRIAEGPSAAPKEAAPTPSTPDAHEAAVEAIKDGLGATELIHDEAEDYKNNSDKAPWDEPAIDAPKKPWQTETLPPAVTDPAW